MSKQVFTGQDDLANHLKLHLGGDDRNLDLNPLLTEIRWALTLGFSNNVLFFIGPPQSGKTKLISSLSLASVDNDKEKITTNNGSENSVVTLTAGGGCGGEGGGGLALVDTMGFLEDNIDSFHQIKRDFEFCRPNTLFTVLRSSDLKMNSSSRNKRARDTLMKSKLIFNDYSSVKCNSTFFVGMNVNTTTNNTNEIIITHAQEYDPEFFDKFKEMIHKFQIEYLFEKIEKGLEITRERVKEAILQQEINHLQKTPTISPPKKGLFYLFSSNCDIPAEGQRESDLGGKQTELYTVTSKLDLLETELRSLKEISIKKDPQWMDKLYNYAIFKYVEYLSRQNDPLPFEVSIENDLIKKVKRYAGPLTEIKFEDLILEVFKEQFQSNVHFQAILSECGWSYADTKIHFIFDDNNFRYSHNEINWGIDSLLNSIQQSSINTNPYQRKVQLAQAITGHFCKLILDHWQIINTCEVLPHHVVESGVSNNNDIPSIVYLLVKTLSIIETTNDPTRSYLEAINKLKNQQHQIIGKVIETCKTMNSFFCFNFQYYHQELCKDVKSVAEWATKFYMGSDEEEITITTTAASTADEMMTATTASRRTRSYEEEDCSSQMKKQKQ